MKQESTDEFLVFIGKPNDQENQFPNDVRMEMKVMLKDFDEPSYVFNMTPSKIGEK